MYYNINKLVKNVSLHTDTVGKGYMDICDIHNCVTDKYILSVSFKKDPFVLLKQLMEFSKESILLMDDNEHVCVHMCHYTYQ